MADDVKFEPSEMTKSLMNISMYMSDGYKFLIMREMADKWYKEAMNGNESSIELVNFIKRFEKLVTIMSETK